MVRLIARRLALSVGLIFVVSFVAFFVENLVPGNAAKTMLGPTGTQAQYQQLAQQLGLNKSLWVQYGSYVGHLLRGSFGTSIFAGQPVLTILRQRLPVTLALVVGSLIICTVIGIGLGIISGLREGYLARVVDVLSLMGLALPNFLVGLILVLLLAVERPWFPATGYVSFTQDPVKWLWYLTLPIIALSLAGIANIAKQMRDAIRDAMSSEYISMLRACGLRRRSIVFRHALRNSAIPIITLMGVLFVGYLGGAVFVEAVFALPGLGSQIVLSASQHDLPVVEGIAVCFALLVVLVNLLVDIAYGLLNPKVRIS